MKNLKEEYLREFITSKNNSKENYFLVNQSELFTNVEFLSYIDTVGRIYLEYVQIKNNSSDNPATFVKNILFHMKKYKDDDDPNPDFYATTKNFFYEFDFPNLVDALKEQFNSGVDLIENAISYFCSYTTKHLPEINNSYKTALSQVYNLKLNRKSDQNEWEKTNFLAKLVVRYLNNHFNNYFYDQDMLKNGELIENQIFKYCSRAAVLIILAQQETFRDNPRERNWCFEEYVKYRDTHKNYKLVIVYKIPDLKKPIAARTEIQEWFEYMCTSKGIKSTTIDYASTHHMIKNKIDGDVEIIDQVQRSHFTNFVINIK